MAPKAKKPTTWRGIPLVRPSAIDLFSGGGGAGRGLIDAGFRTVVGIEQDREHKQSYEALPGMYFRLGCVHDLLPEDLQHFDLVWASPPCLRYCTIIPQSMREKHQARWEAQGRHLDHIPATRQLLKASGRPYIIENVEGAPLHEPLVKLCGTQDVFADAGLRVFRHRIFESNLELQSPGPCNHAGKCTVQTPVRLPQTEHALSSCDATHLPDGVERRRVEYPCRHNSGRDDYVYWATNPEMEALLRNALGRRYARSLKELARATGCLVPMTPEEQAADAERYESERRATVPTGTEQVMFGVYGATAKHRGTDEEWQRAMGCSARPDAARMSRAELCQAVPPAYSKYLGEQALRLMGLA